MFKNITLIKVPIEVIIIYGIPNISPSIVPDNISKLSKIESDVF